MTPLTVDTGSRDVPAHLPELLELLSSRPQPAVVWYGPGGTTERVELSGRVLQNWAIKIIGLFTEEYDLAPGDLVVVDARPHWKAAAVVLAVSALGCEVRLPHPSRPADRAAGLSEGTEAEGPEDPEEPPGAVGARHAALVVTDDPQAWAQDHALGDAELAALSPGLLDDSFEAALGEPLPGWVLDISSEVRQHPDQLLQPLPTVELPQDAVQGPGGAGVVMGLPQGLKPLQAPAETWSQWQLASWDDGAVMAMLSAWAHSGTVVIADLTAPDGPEAAEEAAQAVPKVWDTILRNEAVR